MNLNNTDLNSLKLNNMKIVNLNTYSICLWKNFEEKKRLFLLKIS